MVAIRVDELTPLGPSHAPNAVFERARAAVERDFRVIISSRGDARWTTEALERVHAALVLLDPRSRAELRGVELIRAHLPPPGLSNDLTGVYEPHTATRDARRVRPASITWYDRAFAARAGEQRSRLMPFLVELAHAVAGQPLSRAIADDNAALDRERTASFAFARALRDLLPRISEAEAAARELPAASAALLRPVAQAIHHVLRAKNERGLLDALLALDQAAAERDRRVAELALEPAERARLGRAIEAQDGARGACASAADLRAGCIDARERRAETKRVVLGASRLGVPEVLASFERVRTRSRERPVFGYGGRGVHEAFAESLALYLLEPSFLGRHRPAAYGFLRDRAAAGRPAEKGARS